MADVHILSEGYLSGPDDDRVGSTVSFVRDSDVLVVIDPGLVPTQADILGPLSDLGVRPDEVTDVVLSHHHPDHTLNAGLFPAARVHDHWAWYRADLWITRAAEGFDIGPHVRLMETPGHTPQDISTLVDTDEGLVVFTHLWWTATAPKEDPYATDVKMLHANRVRVLSLPGLSLIVPGHGPPFVPGDATPR
jgi:glyoxylase-like metal-dependent hydrolase (beta-lactamase superfamily II)